MRKAVRHLIFAIFLISGVILADLGPQWPMWRANRNRTGRVENSSDLTEVAIRWRYFTGGDIGFSKFLIEDVTGDGLKDIVIVDNGRIICKTPDNAIQWDTTNFRSWAIYGVFDFNNDGIKDIVCNAVLDGYAYGGTVIINGQNGTIEWATSLGPPLAIPNVRYSNNSDTYISLITHPVWHGIHVWDFHNGFYGPIPIVPTTFYNDWDYYPNNGNHTHFTGRHPNHLWYDNTYGYNGGNPTLVFDYDLDGQKEVVLESHGNFKIWDGLSGTLETSYHYASSYVFGYFQLFQLDSDPYLEIMASGPSGHGTSLYCIDNSASGLSRIWYYEWNIDNSANALFYVPDFFVEDLDNNGTKEVVGNLIIATENGGDGKWHLKVFNAANGQVIADISDQFAFALKDIDNDGKKEILAQSTFQGSIPKFGTVSAFDFTGSGLNLKWTLIKSSLDFKFLHNVQSPLSNSNQTTGIHYEVLTRDMNLNGSEDIFILYDGNNDDLAEKLRVYEASSTPTLLYEYNITLPYQIDVYAIVDHLTGPGYPREILLKNNEGYFDILYSDFTPYSNRITLPGFLSALSVDDIDNDNYSDCAVFTSFENVDIINVANAGPVNSPTLRWETRAKVYTKSIQVPLIVDLDGDGFKNIVVADEYQGIAYLKVFNYNGTLFWSHQFTEYSDTGSYLLSLSYGNFTNDSILDLAVGYRIQGDGNEREIALNGSNGTILWSFYWDNFYQQYMNNIVRDWNNDNFDEVLTSSRNRIWLLDRNGNLIIGPISSAWGIAHTLYGNLSSSAKVAKGPGGLYMTAHNPNNNFIQVWLHNVDPNIWNHPSALISDVNRPGYFNLVTSNRRGNVRAVSGSNGNTLWNVLLGSDYGNTSEIAVGDIDGDNKDELLVGSTDGYLYCLNSEDGSILWTYNFNNPVGNPILADIDSDGKVEILVPVADGYIYALDAPYLVAPSEVRDGTGDDVDYFERTDIYPANWDSVLNATGYMYSIISEFGTYIIPWTDAGNNTSVTVTGLHLNPGTTYYFQVYAYNPYTSSPIRQSDGVYVIPPVPSLNFVSIILILIIISLYMLKLILK